MEPKAGVGLIVPSEPPGALVAPEEFVDGLGSELNIPPEAVIVPPG
jgi:hypothetical protein